LRTAILLPSKKSAAVDKSKHGNGSKWIVVVDDQGLPLGSTLKSASPAEVDFYRVQIGSHIRAAHLRDGHPWQERQRVITCRIYEATR
jgi:hypothetical protein